MIKSDITPFNIHGNIYFVGSTRVSVHIIKTEVGLVMIDTGYPDMYEQILDSMSSLGLKPEDICAIFHSHGHIDHFGCTQKFKELSGAKTYISEIDNDIVNGKYDLSWAKELNYERLSAFNCDVLVKDGDVFEFGNTTVRCRLTPGHTAGVLSFFITVNDGDESFVAAMHGGMGFNTLSGEYLKANNLSFDCREIFRCGLRAVAAESVDLVLGNHPPHNDTVGKLAKTQRGESVIDTSEWQKLLLDTEKNLDEKIAQGF